tara:strand:+ start:506 stop:745 length:240 start_codon:yes stop_codon:yes gene_type:complete
LKRTKIKGTYKVNAKNLGILIGLEKNIKNITKIHDFKKVNDFCFIINKNVKNIILNINGFKKKNSKIKTVSRDSPYPRS